MRTSFSILLFVVSISCFAQVDKGCLSLDFEKIPGSAPMSGLVISDQYKANFGISFRLEDGTLPVLAEVGAPTEAFSGINGSDTPADGVDIGRFFLTDDGSLSGLSSSPLILDFETPIDSFAGCILDVDWGEKFIIHARDSLQNIILADTIVAGDPGTGDGELTCWGFNLPGCIGTISSIRFAGERQQAGAFGLGLDHFSFCYSGLQIDVDRKPEDCNELGSIVVTSATSEQYEFSLDGLEYFNTGNFLDLESGFYTVYVRDEAGCETDVEIYLPEDVPVVTGTIVEPTSCGLNNGFAQIVLENGSAEWYTMDGVTLQENDYFEDLPPGDFVVSIETEEGCLLFQEISIEPSSAPEIAIADYKDDQCEESLGSIQAIGIGEGLMYSINNESFQDSSMFENLSAGPYNIIVEDINGCRDTTDMELETTPAVLFTGVEIDPAICNQDNGSLNILAEGGAGDFLYAINDTMSQNNGSFEDLPGGQYRIIVTDENACTAEQIAMIPTPEVVAIDYLEVQSTTCGYVDGQIELLTNITDGVQYLVNGESIDSLDLYDNLEPGSYNINIRDANGCEINEIIVIEPSTGVVIDLVETTADECRRTNGTMTVSAQSDSGGINYSLDGQGFQSQNEYTDLENGMHTIIAQDAIGCEATQEVEIDSTPIVSFLNYDIEEPECFINSGSINLNMTGGTGQLTYFIDGSSSNESQFTGLAPDAYEIMVTDSLGCESRETIVVPIPLCPIYFPNIISYHVDQPNNLFTAFTHELYDVGIIEYSIYDRWGEQVFISSDFSIHTSGSVWWDGRINGIMAEQDVYTYRIEVLHPNGFQEVFIDDFMLLR